MESDDLRRSKDLRRSHVNFTLQTAFLAFALVLAVLYLYPTFDQSRPDAPTSATDLAAKHDYDEKIKQYERDWAKYLFSKEMYLVIVPGSISAFFGIVYYGTSFEVTPFAFFIRGFSVAARNHWLRPISLLHPIPWMQSLARLQVQPLS